jgi:hypothetical protein
MGDPQQEGDQILAFFNRHVITLIVEIKKADIIAPIAITSFVLSVRDEWVLVTAGHCLQWIDEYKKEGYTLGRCFLKDSMGSGATHFEPVIFVYDYANPQYIRDSREMDYGFIPLSKYYRDLLSANNICPLNEEVWKLQPKEPEFYALIGVPSEFFNQDWETMGFMSVLNFIEECERPDISPESELPLFYGKIQLHPDQTSIKGMSGGPIFAFKHVDGNIRYWLRALQSRWLDQSQIVIGCPTTLLGEALERMFLQSKE